MKDLQTREETLFEHISALIDIAHKRVKSAIGTTMVYTYYGVGYYIVEDEQQGEQRGSIWSGSFEEFVCPSDEQIWARMVCRDIG